MHPGQRQTLYQQQIDDGKRQLNALRRRKSGIGWARLSLAVAGIAGCTALWNEGPAWVVAAAVGSLALFLRLVVLDLKLRQDMEHRQRLLLVQQRELALAQYDCRAVEDGQAFLPAQHPYAHDLDLFGANALFPWLNRAASYYGQACLASWLLAPANREETEKRQAAVAELGPQHPWCQHLQALGMAQPLQHATGQKLAQWASQATPFFDHPVWRRVRWVLPAISLSALALHIGGWLESSIFYPFLLVMFAFSGWISKKATPAYQLLNRIAPELDGLSASLQHLEQARFESPWLQQRQGSFRQGAQRSSVEIRRLNQILNRFDYRFNPLVFVPLNILLLWDLQQMLSLKHWKQAHAADIPQWLESLGEMEAMVSLSTLHFNYPAWCFPTLANDTGIFHSEQLGHPLIPESNRVCSSFATAGPGQVNIVTGSNMAGKSTFLRSVGLAAVLGQAGAPVCAKSLTLSYMQLMSSMRVTDNLGENTSTFYAELKKLREIIEAVNRKEPVFLLLDEILRGTNSLDRHTGSKALVEQLIRHGAAGILATHDLALAEMVSQYPAAIHNYHFDVQVSGEELYFDYLLKTGVCTSLNASVLMKKMGIEL